MHRRQIRRTAGHPPLPSWCGGAGRRCSGRDWYGPPVSSMDGAVFSLAGVLLRGRRCPASRQGSCRLPATAWERPADVHVAKGGSLLRRRRTPSRLVSW